MSRICVPLHSFNRPAQAWSFQRPSVDGRSSGFIYLLRPSLFPLIRSKSGIATIPWMENHATYLANATEETLLPVLDISEPQ